MRTLEVVKGLLGGRALGAVGLDRVAQSRKSALCGEDQARLIVLRLPAQKIADLIGRA